MKFNIFIIIIIVVIYICCYFIFPTDIYILQTNISDFNFSSLISRQPIVLIDFLQEPEKLIQLWFNYNFINSINHDDNWIHNKYKYLFINASKDTEIIIYKATFFSYIPNENDKIIAIKLQKSQSLIIPYRWNYYLNPNDVYIWGINDLVTSSLFF
jgi:hypothetical protein